MNGPEYRWELPGEIEERTHWRIVREHTQRFLVDQEHWIESHLMISLKPKPRWCPQKLWNKIVQRVVAVSVEMEHGTKEPWQE